MSAEPSAARGRPGDLRTAARKWVRERSRGAPPRLGRAVERILSDVPAAADDRGPWDVMARGALRRLRTVRPAAGDREAALELLAADALLTYAFQCAAEEGGDLEAMAERMGPRGRLGEAVARARRETLGETGGTGGTGP